MRKQLFLFVLLSAVGFSTTIQAGEKGKATEAETSTVRPLQTEDYLDTPYSYRRAFLLSLLPTTIPVAAACGLLGVGDYPPDDKNFNLILAAYISYQTGIVFGPSIGHFYARNPFHAWVSMAVRATLAGGGTFFRIFSDVCHEYCHGSVRTLNVLYLSVSAINIGLAAWSIGKTKDSIRRINKRHNQKKAAWAITPILLNDTHQQLSAGVQFIGLI